MLLYLPRLLLSSFTALVPVTAPQPGPDPVVGGQTAQTCDYPASVFVGGTYGFHCTASLVHPRVVITAAHCLSGIAKVGFGESASTPALSTPVQFCEAHPDYYYGGIDLAYCVLAEDAPEVARVPVLMGCEADELVPGKEIYLAGFGQNDEATGSGGGTKRWTTNTVDVVDYDANELYLLGEGTGSCYGDSGGPAYVQLSDGSWRVIAAVSGPHPNAPPLGCGHGGTYELIHPKMEWIEEQTGLDITPCHDADGTWNPDERCIGFPLELAGIGTDWSELCGPTPVSEAGQTCGPPHESLDPDPDPDPGSETTGGQTSGLGETGMQADTGGDFEPTGTTGAQPPDDASSSSGGALSAGPDQPEPEGPGALPPGYGSGPPASGCTVGGGDGRAWWMIGIVVAVVALGRRPKLPRPTPASPRRERPRSPRLRSDPGNPSAVPGTPPRTGTPDRPARGAAPSACCH